MKEIIKGKLTSEKVEELSNRKGAKKIAVQNFLWTVGANQYIEHAIGNLYMDARLYNWNTATINAIKAGIKLAFAG